MNAAIGEDRIDLVWQLADDYMDHALRLLSTDEPPMCGSPDCAVCARSRGQRRPLSFGDTGSVFAAAAPRDYESLNASIVRGASGEVS